MNYKIRFFDIVNCLILGTIFLFSIFFIFSNSFLEITLGINFTDKQLSILKSLNIFIIIILVAITYLSGLLINSMVDWLSESSIKNEFCKKIVDFIIKNSIKNVCEKIKKTDSPLKNDFPYWIFLTERPFVTLSVLLEKISADKDINVLNEYRYLNEFFIGIRTILLLCYAFLILLFIIIFVANNVFFLIFVSIILFYFYKFCNFSKETIAYLTNFLNTNQSILFSLIVFIYPVFGFIFSYFFSTTHYILFYIFSPLIIYLCGEISEYYAKKLIKYIASCISAHDFDIKKQLLEIGLPTAYILIKLDAATTKTTKNFRTYRKKYGIDITHSNIRRAFESIKEQNYQNIKVLLLIHSENDETNSNDNIDSVICEYKNCFEIIKFTDENCGNAGASLKIREIYIDIASEKDVAIFLDKNDKLSSKNSVLNIMTKMATTNADICLLGFTVVDHIGTSLIRDDKLIHNGLLNYIENNNKIINFNKTKNEFKYLQAASTINCAKAYTKKALKNYVDIIHSSSKNKEENHVVFLDCKSLAGFTDFIVFLSNSVTITALSKPTHHYVQTKNRHLGENEKEFNIPRINALKYMQQLKDTINNIEDDINITDEKQKLIEEYILFKLHVIGLYMNSINVHWYNNFLQLYPENSDKDKIKGHFERIKNEIITLNEQSAEPEIASVLELLKKNYEALICFIKEKLSVTRSKSK